MRSDGGKPLLLTVVGVVATTAQTKANGRTVEVKSLTQPVGQIAQIAFRQLLQLIAKNGKCWRPGIGLRGVADLDAPTTRCGWGVAFNAPSSQRLSREVVMRWFHFLSASVTAFIRPSMPLLRMADKCDQGHATNFRQHVFQLAFVSVENFLLVLNRIPL